jgi:hypothetical protein
VLQQSSSDWIGHACFPHDAQEAATARWPIPSGKLGAPDLTGATAGPPWGNPFFYLLPFIEQDNVWKSTFEQAIDPVFLTDPGYQPWYPWFGVNTPGTPAAPLPEAMGLSVRIYHCPGDPSIPNDGLGTIMLGGTPVNTTASTYSDVALTSYVANAQVFGNFIASGANAGFVNPNNTLAQTLNNKSRIPTDFTDGTSSTILFSERYGAAGYYGTYTPLSTGFNLTTNPGGVSWAWWGTFTGGGPPVYGTNFVLDTVVPMFAFPPFVQAASAPQVSPLNWQVNVNPYVASSPHTGVVTVAMVDGSTRTVSEGISPVTWWAAITPNGGDFLGGDW